jgi:hypothetical protein
VNHLSVNVKILFITFFVVLLFVINLGWLVKHLFIKALLRDIDVLISRQESHDRIFLMLVEVLSNKDLLMKTLC